ncbi:phosphatidate cytidylyltransferase [Thiopseudomonas acetoxidans]|uniref:Phosphatidate cytidylyltransferase n=1 Tax=Thiopseudomonas acetoxidans TaxID=3041622 RepID=A0ABT7SNQ0_9GAMM|nr:phosphatidate cytidylyltransferase [Thiopseudomonas sp. CY1220]MDM7857144.1 phosphatidate cytidylyltransferase [Thiopseudomonas sp. CY1220]
MLKQRIITALWLLPLALFGFFALSGWAFSLFVGLVLTLGAWEWAQLAGSLRQSQRVGYAVVTAVLFATLQLVPAIELPVLLVALAWWCAATLMVMSYPRSVSLWGGLLGKLLIGWLVLLPAGIGLLVIKSFVQGNALIFSIMLMVWAADIGAYFSGKALGKRKLAPNVSPGKSWAGLYGGLLASVLVALGCALYFSLTAKQIIVFLIAAVIIVLFSVIGDLTESMFKRQAGVKDSSNLLPGHGGVLDRIDSLTAALPLFALFLIFAGWAVQ